jgi:hypothetical protein
MIILLPIGGQGSRFKDAGYKIDKVQLPTSDRFSGEKKEMILCAMQDIPGVHNKDTKIICVGRDFHETNNLNNAIRRVYPNSIFLVDNILKDQAYGCYLAKEYLEKYQDEELFIGCCDSGMDIDISKFQRAKENNDVLVVSHSGDVNIENNPLAHSWLKLDENQNIIQVKLKETVSDNFIKDHATTGMFWFKKAKYFLDAVAEMINKNDSFNEKFYVDHCINYCIKNNLKTGFFDIIYHCWGTPTDYENYEKTVEYWKEFRRNDSRKDKKNVSIIVPCFNEERNIELFIPAINKIIDNDKNFNFEVIIIDGHSSDQTLPVALQKINNIKDLKIKIYQRDKRYGYGSDIAYGLSLARGDILCWTHADMQTDPKDILLGLKFFAAEDNNKFIIKGKRVGRNFIDYIFTLGMQIFVLLLLRINISDINAQPKIFTRKFYEEYLLDKMPSDFSLDLFLLYQAKKNNYKIFTFPVFFFKRLHGQAKGGGSLKGKIKLIKRTIKYIIKLKVS